MVAEPTGLHGPWQVGQVSQLTPAPTWLWVRGGPPPYNTQNTQNSKIREPECIGQADPSSRGETTPVAGIYSLRRGRCILCGVPGQSDNAGLVAQKARESFVLFPMESLLTSRGVFHLLFDGVAPWVGGQHRPLWAYRPPTHQVPGNPVTPSGCACPQP